VTADTVVPNPTDPQSLNRYSYVRNNPMTLIDPSGHTAYYFVPPGGDPGNIAGNDYIYAGTDGNGGKYYHLPLTMAMVSTGL